MPLRRRLAALVATGALAALLVAVVPAAGAGAATATAPGGSVQWRPEGRTVLGRPVVYRGSTGGVEVAWLDPALLSFVFVGGNGDPGAPWSWGGQVAPEVRSRLVAAFNGGFKLGDGAGGWYTDGRVNVGLTPGRATAVIYRDGHLDVGEWGRQVDLTADVVSARQNLIMLVDNGAPTAAAASTNWGGSVAGIATARSAVGVDANGGVVLGQARVSPAGLANAMVSAGAVRAMQLDINPDWTSMVVYDVGADGSVSGRQVMGAGGPGGLFLTPYSRDFFAVLIRPTVAPGGTGSIGLAPVKATGSAARS